MKKIISIFFVVVFLSAPAFSQESLPLLGVKTINGLVINTSKFIDSSKPTLISFWATWCKPCRQELDAISEDWEEFKTTGANFIALAIDDSRSMASIKSIISANGWEFPVYVDDNQELKRALNIDAIPHAIVIDKNGRIIKRVQGYNPGEEKELFNFLRTVK